MQLPEHCGATLRGCHMCRDRTINGFSREGPYVSEATLGTCRMASKGNNRRHVAVIRKGCGQIEQPDFLSFFVASHILGFGLPNTVDGRNPFRSTSKPWEPWFVGIYSSINIPGFLRWCRILSIHSSNGKFIEGSLEPTSSGASALRHARGPPRNVPASSRKRSSPDPQTCCDSYSSPALSGKMGVSLLRGPTKMVVFHLESP